MANGLSFELLLLDRMSEAYKASALREIGLTPTEAARIREQCTLKLPEQLDSDLTTYATLVGTEVKKERLSHEVPEVFAGSRAHYFLLMLWPHLYWVVNSRPDGQSWGVGFQNQAALRFDEVDPCAVRVGLWTRTALERIADHHELYDGWDEQIVIRFTFGQRRYEGSFVFGLLQDWREL